MNLAKKTNLAAKTLGVGKERIVFNTERLNEIKEAITRQDIRDLFANKAIMIKDVSGRRTKEKRKTRRRVGSIRKRPSQSKRDYINLTRKLRYYIRELLDQEKLSKEKFKILRKQIRASIFKSKSHLKESLSGVKK
jgi:large subunit ribosomal protein L19e